MEIGEWAFSQTALAGTLVIPNTVTTIGNAAFANTNLTGLNLSKATSLVEIGNRAFLGSTALAGTLVIPAKVTTISKSAFSNTKLTSLDLSNAAALVEIEVAA